MRQAYKVWTGIAAGVFLLVACQDLAGDPTTPSTPVVSAVASPAPAPTVPAPTVAPAVPRPATAASVAGPDTVTVTEVIDGDTFVADGQKVRVLGIDSCEMSTYGGEQARSTAESIIGGQAVVLTREPGVDRDRYGRSLRYVATASGTDLGESMVGYAHTGVYRGSNDASTARLAELRERDTDGRDCSAPAPVTSSGSYGDTDVDLPGPTPGDQGLPDGALTGGYCSKKWWC